LNELNPPQDISILQRRLKSMRLQPDFEKYGWRESTVFGLTRSEADPNLYSRVLVVVRDENFPLYDDQGNVSQTWQTGLAEPEVELLEAALQRQTSLSQVTQFDREVSDEAKVQAYVALALSWIVIIVYLWFRFGSARWGMASVIALVHDVIVAAGAIALTKYIAGTFIGDALMINETFRIDLAVVAALLTIIGFSVNDTIVILDRIRENRGRLKEINAQMVNDSINQTMSRTILTTFTVVMTVIIMYIWGGRGIHHVNFALLIGMLSGTYSTCAIATQFLLTRKQAAAANA
ncbi:MAG TPA: protein translocase subunit SecF, partial [Phycisphaerae bacterium]|nr:protein translocase subunit SecF [Phycisphaerae bacterium]